MKGFIMLCIASCLLLCSASPLQAKDDPVQAKGMWVWDYYHSVHTEEQREQLIQFALVNHINLLFVGTRLTLSDHPEAYADLIQRAHEHGIRLYALAGEASWALEDRHAYALEHIRQVLDFNADHPSNPFDGLQLDIEPYTLSGFSDHMEEISSQFLRLLDNAAALVAEHDSGKRLALDAAVPFWYAASDHPRTVTYNGASKPLSHHILDIVDSVSIMAYRDNADEQIELSRNDVEYAGSLGKIAYIGTETMPPDGEQIPERITYHHKKVSYMNDQLDAIYQAYSGVSGFGGVAIHSYDSFKIMKEREEIRLTQRFQELKAAGIMTGYADGSAGFEKSATRAELAAIAARMSGFTEATTVQPSTASFQDVPQDLWFYGWIETAHRMGVMQGRGGGVFDPDAKITMEEALIVMAKLLNLPESEGAAVQGSSPWAHGWIQSALNHSLMESRQSYIKEMTRGELVDVVFETYTRRR